MLRIIAALLLTLVSIGARADSFAQFNFTTSGDLQYRGRGAAWNTFAHEDPSTHVVSWPLSGNISTTGGSLNVINLYTTPPTNFFGASGNGAAFSINPEGGHPPGDSERTAIFTRMTTAQNPLIGEFGNFNAVHIGTGLAYLWVTGVTYPANSFVHAYGSGSDQLYFSAAGGTAGATQPSCVTGTCSDGSITWTWQGMGILDEKVGTNYDCSIFSGAGHVWCLASDLTLNANSIPYLSANVGGFAANHELDTTDGAKDCPAGVTNGCQIYNLFLNGSGVAGKAITAELAFGGASAGSELSYNSINIASYNARNAGMAEGSLATYGFQQYGGGTQVYGYWSTGAHSAATFYDQSTAPIFASITGTYSTAIFNAGTATATYFAVLKNNQSIAFNGFDDTLTHAGSALSYGAGGSVRTNLLDGGGITTTGPVTATQINTSGASPSVSSCGTSPAIATNSTNMGGKFTTGTGAPTSCAITFATSGWTTAAFCTITAANSAASGATILPYISTQSNTGFTVTFAAGLTSGAFNYGCSGT